MREGEVRLLLADMAANGMRDQDKLDRASNYVISKARISCLLDEHDLKAYVNSMVVVPTNVDLIKKSKAEMVKAKRLILDEVRDHVVCHIVGKGMAKEMRDALAMLYQGSSELRKMYLEEKISTRMEKGERINLFLSKLQAVQDQLAVTRSVPHPTEMVRLALNKS